MGRRIQIGNRRFIPYLQPFLPCVFEAGIVTLTFRAERITAFGNSSIDIVSYGSHGGFYENIDLRIYVTSPTVDELLAVFKIAEKVIREKVLKIWQNGFYFVLAADRPLGENKNKPAEIRINQMNRNQKNADI